MNQTEAIVAQTSDFQNGEMRQVTVGETDVLLVKLNDTFYATSAYCTHYQAPLADGVLSGQQVVCPWHNAYFDIPTGDQQEPPGLDSLCSYAVRVEGDRILVSVPADALSQRPPAMAAFDPTQDQRTFVVLGAGAAGAHAVETLRVAGYQGSIVMITQDDRLPYDRTWLSKDYFIGKVSNEQLPLRSAEFYQQHNIETRLNQSVARVDAIAKLITFANGDTLNYDALLIATGGTPRSLKVPGSDLPNVFTLRSAIDADRILSAAKAGDRAVVVGTGFIGMEVAAGLAQNGVNVTVVAPSVPFEKVLGQELGQLFQQVHEENGVTFHLGTKVIELQGTDTVEAALLENGERLPVDLVVVGMGVQPATEFLEGVNLHSDDQSILVNQQLQAAEGLYAAGDVARYPDWRTGESIRVEHWRIAAQHGRIAAYNMAGNPVKFRGVPIFWTLQFQFPLRYVGHATEWDEIIVNGALQEREFIAFYIKDKRILAAAGSQRDTEMAAIEELMRLDQMPSPDTLRNPTLDLVGLLS